jgi:hypothetical protein
VGNDWRNASGKEETVRINHLPKEHFVGQKNVEKWSFLKKFTTTCSRNIALFYRTVNSDSIRKEY